MESASHGNQKLCSTRNVSVDHVNPGLGGHTESASHGDQKLCSTRHKNSFPSRRYGCTNIADIVTPFGFSRNNVSVDHVNPGVGGHTESASHGDRNLCSSRHENSSPGCRYGCTNITDIVTPFGLFSSLPGKNWP
ncbi:hypothetical protein Taro_044673 [Colocasia esculenta]|uniref:Uncharacterized protein n=1 Tax=Colocasia esculenta TaxID=4460 RepID=A0A843WJV1_COLES|nr:hypothetical protein [Colocasia esculenta]